MSDTVKFPDDFKVYENVFALSFSDVVGEDGMKQSDLVMFGDVIKLEDALVQQMIRHQQVADLIYNAAYEFHKLQLNSEQNPERSVATEADSSTDDNKTKN